MNSVLHYAEMFALMFALLRACFLKPETKIVRIFVVKRIGKCSFSLADKYLQLTDFQAVRGAFSLLSASNISQIPEQLFVLWNVVTTMERWQSGRMRRSRKPLSFALSLLV